MTFGLNEKDIVKIINSDNSELFNAIRAKLDNKLKLSANIKQLQKDIEQLQAPEKSREAVIREVLEQMNQLVEATNKSTDQLKNKLKASDELRQKLFDTQLANIDTREKAVAEAEAEMRKGFPKLKKEATEQFAASEKNLVQLIKTLDARLADLTEVRDKFTTELSKDAMERLSLLAAEIDTKAKELREERLTEIQDELNTLRNDAKKDQKAARQALLEAEETRDEAESRLEEAQRFKEAQEAKQKSFDEEVRKRVKLVNAERDTELKVLREKEKAYDLMLEELGQAKCLIEKIKACTATTEEELRQNPEVLIDQLQKAREQSKILSDKLAKSPPEEYRQYKELYEKMQRRENELIQRESEVATLESEKERRKGLEQIIRKEREDYEKYIKHLQEQLDRTDELLNRYQKDASMLQKSKDECYAFLEAKENCPVSLPEEQNEKNDKLEEIVKMGELDWLKFIHEGFSAAGFSFDERILYSFHTALKNNELSPITVLAGVSGTGKSELPHLYATLGGLNFYMVSVLPNWDSPESLLGFYNSLDNRFEAQPLTHFLARCTNVKDGFRDQMNIVLLDEMNLAHMELYFAEFLSLLERRRGYKNSMEAPKLKLMLSSGVPHYEIPVSRNVLWTGTMNQDETTKALSDKVLDRSSCIYFPRPTLLFDREKLTPIVDSGYRLPRKTWMGWCKTSIEDPIKTELTPFRAILQKINDAMGAVGRAVGHRVWQSMSYYMVNYPTLAHCKENNAKLKEQLKIAFEDQLVQKVMPKLRGIETRGRSKTECLDKIRSILANEVPTLEQDFNNAMQFGQGQFLWLSSEYLQKKSN